MITLNNIIADNEAIHDEDAVNFYEFLSLFIGKKLDPKKDRVELLKPTKKSRNSEGYLVYAQIGTDRKIAFKRCKDTPEYIRRELAVSQAQLVLKFPSYKITKVDGMTLRNEKTKKNCKIFSGWENKTFLVIDYGNPSIMKELNEINKNEIDMIEFFKKYGRWAAFNILLGVRDRHASNFVVLLIDETLYSVDNEEGPFDDKNILIDPTVIANQIKFGIARFFKDDLNESVYRENFRQGFIEGWDQIAAGFSSLNMFNKKETDLLQNSIKFDSSSIFKRLFS